MGRVTETGRETQATIRPPAGTTDEPQTRREQTGARLGAIDSDQGATVETGDVIAFATGETPEPIAVVCPPEALPLATSIPVGKQPDAVMLQWVNGYSVLATTEYGREAIHGLLKEDRATIIQHGVSDVEMFVRACETPEMGSEPSELFDPVDAGARLHPDSYALERTYSLSTTNAFLDHSLINHRHGRVEKAKAQFLARRPDDRIAAALTINSVNARCAFDRTTVEITRYASHPEAKTNGPDNTASWMISRALSWAALEGYTTVETKAGTAGNKGGIYEAANFEFDGFAESSGDYEREGRQNFDHDERLRTYVKSLSRGGDKATAELLPRYDARLAAGTDEPGADAKTHTLTEFCEESGDQKADARTVNRFQFTREEKSDYKFIGGDRSDAPAFSSQLRDLVTDVAGSEGPLAGLENARNTASMSLPAAAFGAAVDGTLVACLLVSGDPTADEPAVVEGYFARDTAYPQQTAQWVLAKAREWAPLAGYPEIEVPDSVFEDQDRIKPSLARGVGFEQESGCHRKRFH